MMKSARILLAEDDADDRFIFTNFLADRHDIELMQIVENGNEVFTLLDALDDSALPDIIILDHNMPRMNGRQALQLLKKTPRYTNIPVFIYSTYADAQLIESCTGCGAAMVATKPITKLGYHKLIDEFLVMMPV